ncbi:hypothetical protein ACJX0J_038791 [Zea mays]
MWKLTKIQVFDWLRHMFQGDKEIYLSKLIFEIMWSNFQLYLYVLIVWITMTYLCSKIKITAILNFLLLIIIRKIYNKLFVGYILHLLKPCMSEDATNKNFFIII